jgi:hypothetical protein
MAETVVTETAQTMGGQGAAPEAATSADGAQSSTVTIDVAAEIKKALEESDKKWQSRFDKVLTEKKTVENAKLSVEERVAKVEQERAQERREWARKEARAKAAISDEMEAAIQLFHAEDPEDIGRGAAEIRKLIDAETAPLKAKIEELEKKNKYGASAPAGGGAAVAENTFSRAAMNANPDLRKKYSDALMAGKQVSLID